METQGWLSSPLLARWLTPPRGDVAVMDELGEHTFEKLDHAARAIASELLAERRSLGGERVGLYLAAGARFVEALFGVLYAGGAAVVLSPLHPARERSFFCADAGVSTILSSRDLAPQLAELPAARLRFVEELRTAAPPATTLPSTDGDSAALQIYTSGSTGKPKGVVLTHLNLAVQQDLLREAWGLTSADVLLHTLPLHHVHGLGIALLSVLGAGGAVRFLSQFDARAVWTGFASASVFMAVPTIYAKLLAAYDAADKHTQAEWARHARSLRLATSGSAALPVTLGERWRALAGTYPLERYGMTEIGVGASNPLDGERRPGTVGRPLPTVRTLIVAEDGAEAATGELWVAGPSVFGGYFQRDEANREAFVARGAERWFRTGDTVTREADGYLRILGRSSVDILKSGGYKLSALEIEEVLREHSAVAEAAVVGLPDETWGERVVACVVLRAAGQLSIEEELRSFSKQRLAGYKVPKQVVVMPELPRNSMGKVMKPALVALLSGRASVAGNPS